MRDTLINLSGVLFSTCALWSAVSAVERKLRRNIFCDDDRWVTAAVMAAMIIGYAAFVLGLLHALYSSVFVSIWAMLILASAPRLFRETKLMPVRWRALIKSCGPFGKFLIFAMAIRAAIIFLGGTAQLPFGGAEADVLHYHLLLPRLYLAQHSMSPLNWSIPDKYPLLLHMLFMAGMPLAGPLFAKTVVFSAYLGSQFLVYRLARRIASFDCALCAAAVFGGVPALVIQAGTAMIDPLTLFLSLAAVEGALQYRKEHGYGALILSALATGALASSRSFMIVYALFFTGLFFLLAPGAPHASRAELGKRFILYAALVLAVYVPWPLRAWRLTGNPFFPLAAHWFGGNGLNVARVAALDAVRYSYGFGKGVRSAFLLPWNLTFRSKAFDYPVGPVFLGFLPLLFAFCRGKEIRFLSVALAGYTILWFEGSQQTRYLYFSLAIFLVMLACALDRVDARFRGGTRVLLFLLGLNVVLSCVQAQRQYVDGWRRLAWGETNASYLRARVRHADSLQMLEEHTPPSARVLLVDSWPEYLYYMPRYFEQGGYAILATDYWDASQQSPESLTAKIHERRITHLLIDRSTGDLSPYILPGAGHLVSRNNSYALYEYVKS